MIDFEIRCRDLEDDAERRGREMVEETLRTSQLSLRYRGASSTEPAECSSGFDGPIPGGIASDVDFGRAAAEESVIHLEE